MKRWFFGEKKHIDEEKKAQEAKSLSDLRWLMDNGTEDEYVAYVTGMRPEITPTELQSLIGVFYEQRGARRQKRHDA